MSGIVGIYYFDGRPAGAIELDRMLKKISHRGPDASGIWSEGAVGLGHQMLRTTTESFCEQLPRTSKGRNLFITSDARIDNRNELINTLGLNANAEDEISDSELILSAYERWADGCSERLLGDFAFAIWDSTKQRLFCARDHFGVKPFYYHASEKALCFATEIKALLCLPFVPFRLNDTMVADYLTGAHRGREETLYEGLMRLPPGHNLTADRNGLRLQSYWSLDPHAELRLKSDEQYTEAFRELFTEAVDCRTRSALPIGSMLSGGLDSSSITCRAQELLAQDGRQQLQTYSAIFDQVAQCDERLFINAVRAEKNIDSHFVIGDQKGPLTDLDRVLWHEDKPVFGPNLFLHWELYKAASHNGVRVILDGFDGDSAVSHGYHYLNELASEGRWFKLTREAIMLFRNLGDSPWKPLARYAQHYGLNPLISRSRALKTARRIWRALARRSFDRNNQSPQPFELRSLINPDYAESIGIGERYRAWRKAQSFSARTERESHYRTLTQDSLPLAFELFDGAAAAFGIEARYPFWDKRLVEFCLSLPPEQKLRRGWSRFVLRKAMAGILPEKIQWRRDKIDFIPVFHHGLLTFDRERLDEDILNRSFDIEKYVNVSALHDLYSRIASGKPMDVAKELLAFWKVASFALWAQHARKEHILKKEVIPV